MIDGLGDAAFDENLAAPRRAATGSAWAGRAVRCAQLDPNLLVHKSLSFSRPVVFAYIADAPGAGRARRAPVAGAGRWHDQMPPIERHALDAAAQAHAAAGVARDSGRRWCSWRESAFTHPPERMRMILGMNHFTIAAESRDATIDSTAACSASKRAPSGPGLSRRVAVPARRQAGGAAHLLGSPDARHAHRRDRSHGVHLAGPESGEGALRRTRPEVRPAPAESPAPGSCSRSIPTAPRSSSTSIRRNRCDRAAAAHRALQAFRVDGRVALITGGAQGIGAGLRRADGRGRRARGAARPRCRGAEAARVSLPHADARGARRDR